MTQTEVYDKFFIDEEYDLENAPTDTYSYRSGWNNALKRASIIVRNEIRPQGKWVVEHDWVHCFPCGHEQNYPSNFCPNCGARMQKGDKS